MPDLIHTRWQALGWTGVAVVLSLMTWFSATAIIPELTLVLSLTSGQSAWLTNGVQAGFVAGALAASILSLADVWKLTSLMALAALLAAISNAVLLVSPGALVAIFARVVTGLALALVYPTAMKLIATWFKTGRGLAMGTMVGALTLGSALPHLVRALGGGFDWRAVIITSSLACLGAAVIFGFVLREGPYSFGRTRVDPAQLSQVLRNRPAMLANIGYFGHMWELYAMWGWFLVFGTASLGAAGESSLTMSSLIAFAVIALGAPSCVLGGVLADRIGRCNTTALSMTVSGSCAVAIGLFFGGPVWLFLLVAALWGFTIVADSAQFSAAVTELSDPTLVGSALAFQMGVGFAITMVTIWLVPQVADLTGSWRWSFLVLAPGPAIGVWAMLKLRGDPRSILMANGLR